MIGKKKLSQIKAEVAALLRQLPGSSPRAWLGKEIESAKVDEKRDVQTLEMLCAALERTARKGRQPKSKQRPAR
jgi:hypothetical protein